MARRLIITCMKNEGPFILEWLAHHLSIGFDHVLVFTNDCDDGTVELLDKLSEHGFVTRMDNPYLNMRHGVNPQKGALKYAQNLDLVKDSEWILISDVDEYANIHVGDGELDDLFAAVPKAEMISMQWRLFGNASQKGYDDVLLTEKFTRCAPEFCHTPIQAWGMKTLFKTQGPGIAGSYGKLGVHRPLRKMIEGQVPWVNGSGAQVPEDYYDEGWRFGIRDYGYELVTLNHYAVRSAESFLVKRDRGRVNHVNRDQGSIYWLRMNFNMEEDTSIQRRVPKTKAMLEKLLALEGIKELHETAVALHRQKIQELLEREDMSAFFDEITSEKMDIISRHLNFVSRGSFQSGPKTIPDELIDRLREVPVLS
ncbi:glycosyltransferase family 2 protein [Falsihalocynthiibacter sp. SS001]|uniref:glycosyltransferase family 2 protein n=1 Tax=Falsihalocynthiibacter sp. SS001 TaxID=3349698 RepID=UPI0036D2CEBD